MLELTPLVEPVSIDEAFLDLTGTERLHHASPAVTLARFARRIETEIGITLSVGLSYNKFLAKIASDLDKPRGFSVIGRVEAAAFLADRPVTIIPGIGAAAQTRLAKAGITMIRHLRGAPDASLAALGRDAARLRRLAAGEDNRPVSPARETKSVSAETTFEHDLTAFEDLQPILWRLCERVALRLKRADLAGRSVTLKLKDSGFRLRTRTRSGLPATQLAGRLFEPAQALLREECKEMGSRSGSGSGAAFRLIGIAAADLCAGAEADLGDLADIDVRREAQREAALDRIRERFGRDAVQKGLAFRR
jgi:DNA polymerase-4